MPSPDFVKVYSTILDSSIANNFYARIVFEDLLKLADWQGVVDKTPEAIARRTGWPFGLDRLRECLAMLEEPDPDSRNPEAEGRRIVRLDEHRTWGWRIVSIEIYRAPDPALESRRAADRERKRRQRGHVTGRDSHSASRDSHVTVTHIEEELKEEKEPKEHTRPPAEADGPAGVAEPGLSETRTTEAHGTLEIRMPAEFDRDAVFARWYDGYPRKEKRARAEAAFRRRVRTRAQLSMLDAATERYREHCRGLEEGRFIMQAATFLGRFDEWAVGNPLDEANRIARGSGGAGDAMARDLRVGSTPGEPPPETPEQQAERLKNERRAKWAAVEGPGLEWQKAAGAAGPPSGTWSTAHAEFTKAVGVTPEAWTRLREEFDRG